MSLTLAEERALSGVANVLYSFLPWSGHRDWKGHVNFRSIAARLGLEDYWEAGSKLPGITKLLGTTLERQRHRFERLIVEVVKEGIHYREKRAEPIRRGEIEELNGHLLQLQFKFPDLVDEAFLGSLELDRADVAKQRMEQALAERAQQESSSIELRRELSRLKDRLYELHNTADRQRAGKLLEGLLNDLFSAFGLKPRRAFRVQGEEMDGSFELDDEVYLVEAKWEKEPLSEAPLLVFKGKIEGKAAYTRGVILAMNGYSSEAQQSLSIRQKPRFFAIDGHDLHVVLEHQVTLMEFLRQRRRLLADEGAIFVPYAELWKGSRRRRRPEVDE